MKKLLLLFTLLLAAMPSYAQTSGAAGSLIENSVNCATTTYGTVVGTPNPLTKPVVTQGFTGTMPGGTYYTVYTFYDFVGHETQPSAETVTSLSGNMLTINAPVSGIPATAMGMRIYIGTTSGAETLQGSTIGADSYLQTVALVSGASLPTINNTICKLAANDAMWPLGTGYEVAMTDPSGNTLPGYPMQWQMMGPGTNVNISSGIPYYHGVVMFPSPILANPSNRAQQFINGPLTVNGNFNVTGSYLLNGQPFSGGGGGGGGPVLSTNGVNNALQNALNFQNGTGTTVSNPSGGNEQVAVIYGTTANTAAQGNDSRFNNAVACLGCTTNNRMVIATAAGQITDSSNFSFDYDDPNQAIESNLNIFSNSLGQWALFVGSVPATYLAKNPDGVFVPVASGDGPDTPTYVVTARAGSNGYIAKEGFATCYVDNAATAGDYLAAAYNVSAGTSACHDIGASLPASCTWVVGQVNSTGTATPIGITVIGAWYGCGGTTGGITGSGTIATLPVFVTNTTTLGNSFETEANSTFSTAEPNGINASQLVTTGALSQSLMYQIPNDGSTGTTVYLLAKIVSNTAITAATTDTSTKLYPVAASVSSAGTTYAAGTTGNPPLVTRGQATVTADAGGVTLNHYVGSSVTTGGDVVDLGAGPILKTTSVCLGQANLAAITASTTGTIDYGNCPTVTGPQTFASLPSCSASYEGISIGVSDANANTWGTAITAGSSTSHVLAYCDGSAWTVAGK